MSPIVTREATIITMGVSVAVMKMNDRQVTLAVFRQLKAETPIEKRGKPESIVEVDGETTEVWSAGTGYTYALRGPVWGRINYFWTGCAEYRRNEHGFYETDRYTAKRIPQEHAHIVWQLGDELRRACMTRDEMIAHGLVAVRQLFIAV